MSDEPRDDETGRALGRAIGSQPVRETPYAASRLARRLDRPASRGWTYALPMAAALALFVAMGWFFARGPQGVATPDTSPTPAVSATTGPAPTASATAIPTSNAADAVRVYFARDQLPPVGGSVPGPASFQTLPAAERISARVRALWNARPPSSAGLFNVFPPRPGGTPLRSVTTTISSDTATVIIDAGAWDALSSAETIAVVGQLVYTITEEPGIRRAALREPAKDHMVIGTGILRDALAREDVFGYEKAKTVSSRNSVRGFGEPGGPERKATTSYSVDSIRQDSGSVGVPGLARFVIEIAQPAGEPTRMYPDWTVSVAPNDDARRPDHGKWRLTIQVDNTSDTTTRSQIVDLTPLRSITSVPGKGPGGVGQPGVPQTYELGLDDLRPWRTALLFDPVRIVVDIGGHPNGVLDRNAVYLPRPGDTIDRAFRLSGVASAFEANVQYRIKDAQGRVVTSGHTTATNCCEQGGVFDLSVQIPASVPAGAITLEVYQGSPRDGSDMNLIAIRLTLR